MGIVVNRTRLNPFPVKSASGEFISIDDAVNRPVKKLEISFTPQQDLHGYDSPWIDNVYDKVPYNSRSMSAVGVSRLGNYEYDKIVGCSYDWNQLYDGGGSTGTNAGVTYTNNGDGSWKISGTSDTTSGTAARRKQIQSPSLRPYHVHWISARAVGTGAEYVEMVLSCSGVSVTYTTAYNGRLYKSSVNYTQFSFRIEEKGVEVDCVAKPQIIDLTKVFGEEVADYIYNLGQTDGIAFLQALFPKEAYAPKTIYSPIYNVNVSSHITRDSGGNAIGTYALDSSLQLRGILKLDANNKLYCDGDIYASNGTVTRKYASVDLSTLTWEYVTEGVESPVFVGSTISGAVNDPSVIYDAIISRNYEWIPFSDITLTGHEDSIAISDDGTKVYIQDASYTTVQALTNSFTTYSSELVYKLGTPTTESATPFTSAQAIDAGGSEEYVDYAESQGLRDVAIPVGHESNYANICPFSGYEGLNFNLSSPNLYDGVWEYGNISETTGQNSGNSHSFFRSKNYLPIPYGQKLYYYSPFRSGAFRQFFYDENYNFLWRNGETWNTVSDVKNAVYMRFRVSGTYTEEQDSKISMNVPSTDHAFVEHHGETIPVSWQTEAGEIFGGTLDLISGVITAKWGSSQLDGTESKYEKGTYNRYFITKFSSNTMLYARTSSAYIKADRFFAVSASGSGGSQIAIFMNSEKVVGLQNVPGISTVQQLQSWLSASPVQICYRLYHNVTYQLSPHQISTLMGSNRLWTDVGTISLDYRAMRSAQNTPLLGGLLGNLVVPTEPEEPEEPDEEMIDEEPIEVLEE